MIIGVWWWFIWLGGPTKPLDDWETQRASQKGEIVLDLYQIQSIGQLTLCLLKFGCQTMEPAAVLELNRAWY